MQCLQNKTTIRYYYTPIRTAQIETKQNTWLMVQNASKDVEQQEFSFIANMNTKWYSHLGR